MQPVGGGYYMPMGAGGGSAPAPVGPPSAPQKPDRVNAAWALIIHGIINAVLWLMPLIGTSWNHKEFNGVGAEHFILNTGLIIVDVDISCGKNIVEDQVCKLLQVYKGRHTLKKTTDYACQIGRAGAISSGSQEACHMFQQLYYASFAATPACLGAAAGSGAAAGLLYYYSFVSPLKVLRQYTFLLFIL